MRISDWSSDVCSSDLLPAQRSGNLVDGGDCGAPGSDRACDRGHGKADVAGRRCDYARLADEDRIVGDADGIRVGAVGANDISVFCRVDGAKGGCETLRARSEEHTSELQSLMRNSYAVFCLTKNNS